MEISIIIPTYQMEKFIGRAIRSALDQSYNKSEYEVIVVDDGSIDNTSKILDVFKDDIRIFSHKDNLGLAAARNTGIRNARGRYIVNLDADDYIHKDIVKLEALFLNYNKEFGAVSCDYYIVDNNENRQVRKDGFLEPIACGIMFRKELLIEIGLYDEEFMVREEEELRYRFQNKYKIYNIILPLYRYYKHENNLTNNKKAMDHHRDKLEKKHG